MVIIAAMPIIVFTIFIIIENWLLFQKAGEAGWKWLIPVYNEYILFKIAKKKKLFWWNLALSIALSFASWFISAEILMADSSGIFAVIGLILFVLSVIGLIVISVKHMVALANAFGQSTVFAIGLLLLNPVFVGILVFNNNIVYLKEKE